MTLWTSVCTAHSSAKDKSTDNTKKQQGEKNPHSGQVRNTMKKEGKQNSTQCDNFLDQNCFSPVSSLFFHWLLGNTVFWKELSSFPNENTIYVHIYTHTYNALKSVTILLRRKKTEFES